MKMYSAVITATDMASMRNMLLCLKRYSAAEWDTLSNPMKAHGEMNEMVSTCLKALVSGTKAGSIVIFVWPCPSIEAAKQNVTPAVNRSTSPIMVYAVALLLLMHSKAMSSMASSVTRASPRYTSYPKIVYSCPMLNTPFRK